MSAANAALIFFLNSRPKANSSLNSYILHSSSLARIVKIHITNDYGYEWYKIRYISISPCDSDINQTTPNRCFPLFGYQNMVEFIEQAGREGFIENKEVVAFKNLFTTGRKDLVEEELSSLWEKGLFSYSLSFHSLN